MKYNIGDLFLDNRGKQKRYFIITERYVDGLEPINYRFFITPDSIDDVVWAESIIGLYVQNNHFIHYPAKKQQ